MAHLPRPVTSEHVLEHIVDGMAIIVPLANGEPVSLLQALDTNAADHRDVTVHQMHALHDHPYLHGKRLPNLRHISYFLSDLTRGPYQDGHVDFVLANFSEVPLTLNRLPQRKIVLAACSLPDRHGYVSLGTNADYVASFIGN